MEKHHATEVLLTEVVRFAKTNDLPGLICFLFTLLTHYISQQPLPVLDKRVLESLQMLVGVINTTNEVYPEVMSHWKIK